jgi:hypothetical protein
MSLWEYLAIVAIALSLANALVVLVLLRWNRHQAPNYWEK